MSTTSPHADSRFADRSTSLTSKSMLRNRNAERLVKDVTAAASDSGARGLGHRVPSLLPMSLLPF